MNDRREHVGPMEGTHAPIELIWYGSIWLNWWFISIYIRMYIQFGQSTITTSHGKYVRFAAVMTANDSSCCCCNSTKEQKKRFYLMAINLEIYSDASQLQNDVRWTFKLANYYDIIGKRWAIESKRMMMKLC